MNASQPPPSFEVLIAAAAADPAALQREIDTLITEEAFAAADEYLRDHDEPYCAICGASVGIFIAHGNAWLHYTGDGTKTSPIELYDAGHEPVIAWRTAGAP